jgi:hypothetical protein
MTAREWSFELEPPAAFVTANDRRDRRGDSARPAWRARAAVEAHRLKLPKGLQRVRIDIVIAPEHRRRDKEAYRPTCKAIVDGLGPPFVRRPSGKSRGAAAPGYGLMPNDSDKHLDGEHLHVVDPAPPRGLVTVYITDLTDVPAGRSWTPTIRTSPTSRRGTTKRACNGCSELLGDVTDEEIDAAIAGLPLPDARSECPKCKGGNDG